MQFGPAQRITIADLKPGDFVIAVPAQNRVRGYPGINASVRAVEDRFEDWQQGHWPVASRKVTFNTSTTVVNLPSTFTVEVRRPGRTI